VHDERGNEIAEYDTNLILQRKLYYDPSQLAPIAMSTGAGVVTFNFLDRAGSVVAIANAAGVKQFHYTYLPFGDSHPSGTPTSYCQGTTCGGATGTGFGYVGYRYDYETGLYRTGARYYHPRLGRFLQMDPMGQAGGLNLYAYVENDPLNAVDPSGLLVETRRDGNNVSLILPIVYDGQHTLEQAASFNSGIQSTGSGQIGKINVALKVTAPRQLPRYWARQPPLR